MNHKQKLVFMSAYTNFRSDELNRKALLNLAVDVNKLGLSFCMVGGSYEGVKENGLMIAIGHDQDLNLLKNLGLSNNQDSILYRDHEGNANLIFMDQRESINLGQLVQVSEEEALTKNAYTYVPNLNSYWITK